MMPDVVVIAERIELANQAHPRNNTVLEDA
jgi:hypothetical protein